MINPGSSDAVLWTGLVLLFAATLAAGILYFVFHRAVGRLLAARGKILGIFLSKLNLPFIFLLLTFFLRSDFFKNAFPPARIRGTLLDAALLFFLAFFIVRFVDAVILCWYARRRLPYPLPRVLHALILIIFYLAILFAILKGVLGINITPFLATSAILTMILGLALQGVLGNILAGMSLHFTKSFSRGDWVKIGTTEGVVMDTNWRETRILDRMSNMIVIPNNSVASETITNFTHPDRKTALNLAVKAGFEAPPASVLEALREAARDVPEVLATPAPQAYLLSYDDLGISYNLKFWITDFSRKHAILTEVGRRAWYKFRRRNIDIPVPLSDKVSAILKTAGGVKEVSGVEDEKEKTCLDLLNSDFLRYHEGDKKGELLVAEEEIRELAAAVRRGKYTRGEVLFRQGEKGASCFIVARGLIRGEIALEEHGKKYTSEFRVGPGGIFGEMSLFTGMPRTASGIIEEESELLEIKAEDFAGLIARNPDISEVIAEIVSERNLKNQEFLRKIKELSEKDLEKGFNKKSIIEYLKKFVFLFKG